MNNIVKTITHLKRHMNISAELRVFPFYQEKAPVQWYAAIIDVKKPNEGILLRLMADKRLVNVWADPMSRQSFDAAMSALNELCAEFLNRAKEAHAAIH